MRSDARISAVLIAERSGSGHRLLYVRQLVREAAKLGISAFVLLSAAAAHSDERHKHLSDLDDERLISRPDLSVHSIADVARSVSADLVIVPDGDLWLTDIARRAGWHEPSRLRIVVMRPDPVRSMGQIARFGWRIAKRSLMAAVTLMPGVDVYLMRSAQDARRSLLVRDVSDPIDFSVSPGSIDDVRGRFDLSSGCRWISIVGAVTQRKNVDLVMAAIATMNPVPEEIGLLIAGKCDDVAREQIRAGKELLAASGVRLSLQDRLLTDAELDACIAVSDVVVLAHSNEGPSGVLGKAAVAGTFVVAAGAKSLRRDCQAIERAAWSPLDVTALADALQIALRSPTVRVSSQRVPNSFSLPLLRP